ncbi:MAG: hypothetical protein QOI36_5991 [Pseudonocardiales bacterium]|nr:hypothetical protein [Pseudonocardiales bacterium]
MARWRAPDIPSSRRVSAAAAAVNLLFVEVRHDLWQRLIDDIPELKGDDALVSLLSASVEANVATMLHVLEHEMALDAVDVPAVAIECSQRGIPLHALVRAYRVGHARFLQWAWTRSRSSPTTQPSSGRSSVACSTRASDHQRHLTLLRHPISSSACVSSRSAASEWSRSCCATNRPCISPPASPSPTSRSPAPPFRQEQAPG